MTILQYARPTLGYTATIDTKGLDLETVLAAADEAMGNANYNHDMLTNAISKAIDTGDCTITKYTHHKARATMDGTVMTLTTMDER